MATAEKVRIRIGPGGQVRTIHGERVTPILKGLGPVTIRRATHVELYHDLHDDAKAYLRDICNLPYEKCVQGEQWFADMRQVSSPQEYKNGCAVLGPFDTRQAALEAEVAALWNNGCPVAGDEGVGTHG